jgi:uncharacterized protein
MLEHGGDVGSAVEEWVRLFNQGQYFEAHEVLEGPWLAAREPDKTFLKGLIHAAVALYQYRKGNDHGARTKLASTRGYLEPYGRTWRGVEVSALLAELEALFAPLMALPPGSEVPEPEGPWPTVRLAEPDSEPGEPRFYMILTARHFEETVAFYRDLLEMREVHSWSGPEGSGAMLGAETGIVEIVSQPPDQPFAAPSGVAMAIQVRDVDAWHAALSSRGVHADGAPETKPWGQRLFTVTDPNGIPVIYFSPASL